MIKSELKKCYMKRSMLVFILKNSIVLHTFFACKQTESSTTNLKRNVAILEPIKDKYREK